MKGGRFMAWCKDPHPEKGRALRHRAGVAEAVADDAAED